MASFFDSDKFAFVGIPGSEDGHLYPVHYRELGEKEGHTYSKKVSWADVTINSVPLEKTFEFEDSITEIENTREFHSDGGPRQQIIVNERRSTIDLPISDDDHPVLQKEKWMNRLEKMTPINLPDAKKKNTKLRYPVKPKSKKEVRDEKIFSSGEKFDEMIAEKDIGIMQDAITRVRVYGEYKEHTCWDDGDRFGFNVRKHVYLSPKYRTYCPPEHWITPVIQWDRIWSEMDQIELGRKRSFNYVKPGSVNKDGVRGPAMYFYDENSDDLNYDYNHNGDFIQGPRNPNCLSGLIPFH